mgnify:CR=1 FL=1
MAYRPLADEIRPKNLDEVVGQRHILGQDGLLRRIIESGEIPNLIFYGPSGTGKATVANIIAQRTNRPLHRLNATTASISDIKDIIADIGTLLAPEGVLLYLDEIQYFNKKQQQSLLEFMENGKITLIASTTENPFFYVFGAVLSRSTVFEFKPITAEDALPAIDRGVSILEGRLGGKLELEEDVRIVTIPGVDACACCAPHVGRTGEIGCIKIVDAQHYKGGTRVSILCGSRALADYREKQRSVREISVLLSAPQRETSQAAARMKEELGGQKERCAALSAQLAVYKGARRELANLAAEKAGRAAAVLAPREDGGYDYILASGELDMRLVCREMNGRLGGRGGGSARMAQGCVYAGKKEIEEYIHGI